jgi:hypothetical protein
MEYKTENGISSGQTQVSPCDDVANPQHGFGNGHWAIWNWKSLEEENINSWPMTNQRPIKECYLPDEANCLTSLHLKLL